MPQGNYKVTDQQVRDAVHEHGTFTAAARSLGVTWQAISRRAKQLGVKSTGSFPGMPRKLPDCAELVKEYESGKYTRELAEKYGVRPKRVRELLRRSGAKIRPPGSDNKANFRTDVNQADVRVDYDAGMSVRQIGIKYGMCTSGILTRLQQDGGPYFGRQRRRKVDQEQFKKLFLQGKSYADMAFIFNVSYQTIVNNVSLLGLTGAPR